MTNDLVEQKRAQYERVLNDLLQAARLDGFVLHIEVVPVGKIPTMGEYALVGEVRLAKELYR